ncbi:RidA family protein [Leifsonia kafniensis]|uniref:RidA family protein n=1 Tax=Leifsonia kafniensis TaxID=475957 RepID=A0ABP7KLX4_9MICO
MSINWQSNRTPVPPHPYAHWVANDDWIIVSGSVGFAPDFTIPDDFAEQVSYAIANIEFSLNQAGATLSDVVLLKPYVTDIANAAVLDEVLNRILPSPRPAGGALVAVNALAHPAFKVEFEAWAQRGATWTEWTPGN